MVRENFLHAVFPPKQALCAYILGRENTRSAPVDAYSEAAKMFNEIWDREENPIQPQQIRSLVNHCYDNDIHLIDFLDPVHEKLLRKNLEDTS
jgi:hypothetical protein